MIAIIGGGFFGCCIALHLRKKGEDVVILEAEHDIIRRASAVNQARIHNGYHYPRSYLTAFRSHMNYARFLQDFKSAIYDNFTKIYGIAIGLSKTTSLQFVKFCQKIGSPIEEAPNEIKKLFNPSLIEDIFKVEEFVFDAKKLRKILEKDLRKAGVKVIYNEEVDSIKGLEDKTILISAKRGRMIRGGQVFNCAYSQINAILKRSDLDIIPFKHEWTEMPLIKIPQKLKDLAITILDGPFFSVMPFPPKKLHTLHHVRYTPHLSWTDDSRAPKLSRKSKFLYMIKDATRYIPALGEAKYIDSIFEVKTILQEAENSDKRPILYRQNHGLENFNIIMGGKIDNIYDVLSQISQK